jgi:hypothetical protein
MGGTRSGLRRPPGGCSHNAARLPLSFCLGLGTKVSRGRGAAAAASAAGGLCGQRAAVYETPPEPFFFFFYDVRAVEGRITEFVRFSRCKVHGAQSGDLEARDGGRIVAGPFIVVGLPFSSLSCFVSHQNSWGRLFLRCLPIGRSWLLS